MKAGLCANGAHRAIATVLALGAASPLAAQVSGEPAPAADDTIVITGSYIRGSAEDAALPVDVFSSEDLERSGVDSPLEFIKDLPTVGAVLGDSNQFIGAGNQGSGSISLRSLGSSRTLVLVNGKRTVPSPGDGRADTQLIPLFALDRIEVLTDGAASTYGSDAIAGVANFILKRDFDGVEAQGQYTFVDGSSDDWQASLLVGQDFGATNIMIGGGWQHRSELQSTARDFTTVDSFASNPTPFSSLGNPARYLAIFTNATGAPIPRPGGGPAIPFRGIYTTVQTDVGCEETGGVLAAGSCQFYYAPFDNLVEEEDRYQVIAQLETEFDDTTRFHIDAMYSHTEQLSFSSSPSYPVVKGPAGFGFTRQFTVPRTNPGYGTFLIQSGLGALFGGNARVPIVELSQIGRPLGAGGNPNDPKGSTDTNRAIRDGLRISANLQKDFSDTFRMELGGTYIEGWSLIALPDVVSERYQAALNGFGGPDCNPSASAAGQGGCQYFNPFTNAFPENPALGLTNPFYVPGTENSGELVDWMMADSGGKQNEKQIIADLVFSGETGIDLGGGPVAYAFGGQYRESTFRNDALGPLSNVNVTPCADTSTTVCANPVGPFIFYSPTNPGKLEQNIWAAFAEVNVPIGDRLELIGAARFEDYGEPIGSTFNPKGSFRFEATDFLTLRGSIGTTFRGPLPGSVLEGSSTALYPIAPLGATYLPAVTFGNPDLKPETALTYNVGAIVDYGGLTFSVDFWTYEFEDQFGTTPTGNILDAVIVNGGSGLVDCTSPFASYITFQGGCVQGTTIGNDFASVRIDVINGSPTVTRGLDFAADYGLDVGPGFLNIGAQATWTLQYDVEAEELLGAQIFDDYDAVGKMNFSAPGSAGSLPEWKANAWVNYALDRVNLRYQFKYIDGVRDQRCFEGAGGDGAYDPTVCPDRRYAFIRSYLQSDVSASYTFEAGGAEFRLTGAVENLFDRDPSAVRQVLNYDPSIGNPLGRIYRVGIKATY